jgi:BirA family biotin operon repressor/biotin-[acetyl-CoA-carboxylase] ligase
MNPATVTVLSGLALFRALKGLTGARLSLKWPNDIHFKGLKLSGILVERSGLGSGALVVGIGINVNSRGQDLPPIAVSLREISGRDFDTDMVLEQVLAGQKGILENARLPLDPSLIAEFRTASSSIGRRVRYSGADGTAEGVITDISSGCGLIIMSSNMEKEYLGEVEFIA